MIYIFKGSSCFCEENCFDLFGLEGCGSRRKVRMEAGITSDQITAVIQVRNEGILY